MTISDDDITGYLSMVFGNSSPGDVLHHLVVATAGPGHRTALGLVDPTGLELTMYAIAPDATVDTNEFVAHTIAGAAMEALKKRHVIHFAALGMEVHTVQIFGKVDEVIENQARRLQADGKLDEHPSAIELTMLYAACRDGRRWVGRHYLTGKTAGTVIGPELRVGAVGDDERGPHTRLIRTIVAPRPEDPECRASFCSNKGGSVRSCDPGHATQ